MAKSSNTTDAPTLPEASVTTPTSTDSASNSYSSSCSSSNSFSSSCSSSSSYSSSSGPSLCSQSSSSDSNILPYDEFIKELRENKITDVVLGDSYTQFQAKEILYSLRDKVTKLVINRKLTYSIVDDLINYTLNTGSSITTLILNEGFDEQHQKTLELSINMLCSHLISSSNVKNLILANNEHFQQIAKILASPTETSGLKVSFSNQSTLSIDLPLDGQTYNNDNLSLLPLLDLSFLLPLDLSLPYSDNSSSSSTETSILGNDASSYCSSTSSGSSSSS